MSSSRLSGEEKVALAGLVTTFVVTAAWWALALWPVADSPEWLTRTRYVCFGVGKSGLPDAGGWIGLIAGPVSALGIIFVGWGRAVGNVIRRARHSLPIAGALGVLALGFIALVSGAALRVRTAQADPADYAAGSALPAANYPRLNRVAPGLELTAHDGRVLKLQELRGRVVLLTFAYAHCATVCPVIVHDVLAAQRQLNAAGITPVLLVVTLDPWRDTPARLPAIARDWKFPPQDAWLLGGSVPDVESALRAWEVFYQRNDQNGEVTHPALVYIIDADGRIAFASTGGAAAIAELTRRAAQGTE